MAMQQLTSQQKELCKAHASFRDECKWSLLNKAAYWVGQDGVAAPDKIKWAKSRFLAASMIDKPTTADANSNPEVVERFLVYIKTVNCVDDQVIFNAQNVVDFLIANPAHLEVAAESYFDDQAEKMIF